MELDVVVEWNVEVENRLSEFCDQIATHRHQQEGKGEGHPSSSTPGQADPIASNATPTTVLLLHGIPLTQKKNKGSPPLGHTEPFRNTHSIKCIIYAL